MARVRVRVRHVAATSVVLVGAAAAGRRVIRTPLHSLGVLLL